MLYLTCKFWCFPCLFMASVSFCIVSEWASASRCDACAYFGVLSAAYRSQSTMHSTLIRSEPDLRWKTHSAWLSIAAFPPCAWTCIQTIITRCLLTHLDSQSQKLTPDAHSLIQKTSARHGLSIVSSSSRSDYRWFYLWNTSTLHLPNTHSCTRTITFAHHRHPRMWLSMCSIILTDIHPWTYTIKDTHPCS